jgi:lysophospholipase L1-like esterase
MIQRSFISPLRGFGALRTKISDMRSIKLISSIVLLFVFCSYPTSAARIACVGNSITYGYGLNDREHQSYPSVLQSLLGKGDTVMNFGTNGCTMLKKGNQPYWDDINYKASTDFKPDIVIIMLGTNDAKPFNWSHKEEFASDYKSLMEHYRKIGAKVYVAIPAPVYGQGNFSIDAAILNNEVVPLIRKIADEANAPAIDIFQSLSGKPELFPDSVHPDVEGANLIAKAVWQAISKDEKLIKTGNLNSLQQKK